MVEGKSLLAFNLRKMSHTKWICVRHLLDMKRFFSFFVFPVMKLTECMLFRIIDITSKFNHVCSATDRCHMIKISENICAVLCSAERCVFHAVNTMADQIYKPKTKCKDRKSLTDHVSPFILIHSAYARAVCSSTINPNKMFNGIGHSLINLWFSHVLINLFRIWFPYPRPHTHRTRTTRANAF